MSERSVVPSAQGSRTAILWRILPVVVVICLCAGPAFAAGKYVLAYQRCVGGYENQNLPGGFGNHSAYIHVWDESGNPRSCDLCSSSGAHLASVGADPYKPGYGEIALEKGPDYYVRCVDAQGSASDTSYIVTTNRPDWWGHYSYELGFLYKSNSANQGTFDTTVMCPPFPPAYDQGLNCPYTRSLTYCSVDCASRASDAYTLSSGAAAFHQTFVANASRVVAAKIQATIGGGLNMYWSAQILQGAPGGAQIGATRTSRQMASDEYFPILVRWPATGMGSVQVTPGQTYCLEVFRSDAAGNPAGNMSTYFCNNNYAAGTFYVGSNPDTSHDIMGFVVAMDYENPVLISDVQATAITQSRATITRTTDVAATSRVDYGTTTAYGQSVEDVSLVTSHTVPLTGLLQSRTYHYSTGSSATRAAAARVIPGTTRSPLTPALSRAT